MNQLASSFRDVSDTANLLRAALAEMDRLGYPPAPPHAPWRNPRLVRRPGGRRGEQVPGVKLTDRDVRRIRSLKQDGFTNEELAVAFGVTGSTIVRLLNGTSWSHVA